MNDNPQDIGESMAQSQNRTAEVIEKLFDVAAPGAVFSEPVTAHDQTVITASDVYVGMGYGYGSGAGQGAEADAETGDTQADGDDVDAEVQYNIGGGGGGGGFSTGRPVAAIHISAEGVEVKPIVDATKIALAFFTMLGAMLIMFGRMASNADDMS